jgi:ABC-type transport system involved in cytochrome bd biosynthesis fused ATPase/permease subunit
MINSNILVMEMFKEIVSFAEPFINWMVFGLVIVSGWFITSVKFCGRCGKTFKVMVISLIVTGFYAYSYKLHLGKYVASWFMAFGVHTTIIKFLQQFGKKIIMKALPFLKD